MSDVTITDERLDELLACGDELSGDSAADAKLAIIELLRHRAQAGWQEIASAPKDGTLVDLWHKVGTRICEVWWTDDCWSNCSDDSDYTHWRPVPNDPSPKVTP